MRLWSSEAAAQIGQAPCRAKADYLAQIGDKEAATAAYALTESKTAGAAQRLDLVFSLMRCVAQMLQSLDYPYPTEQSLPSHVALQTMSGQNQLNEQADGLL